MRLSASRRYGRVHHRRGSLSRLPPNRVTGQIHEHPGSDHSSHHTGTERYTKAARTTPARRGDQRTNPDIEPPSKQQRHDDMTEPQTRSPEVRRHLTGADKHKIAVSCQNLAPRWFPYAQPVPTRDHGDAYRQERLIGPLLPPSRPSVQALLRDQQTRPGSSASCSTSTARGGATVGRTRPETKRTRYPWVPRPFGRPGCDHTLSGGGAGNRTRVLRRFDGHSPGAVCGVSTRPHRSRTQVGVTGPVAVSCPVLPRDRPGR